MSGGRDRPRPLGPPPPPPTLRARLPVPASRLRRLLPAAAAAAAREAMEAGAGAGAGAAGWSCPGQRHPSLTSPLPLLPLLYLSFLQTPTSSLPPLLPPFPPKSFSLHPAPRPGPVSIFPGWVFCYRPHPPGSSFPEPPPSRLSSLVVLPALGAPAPSPAPKASERGARVGRARSREGRGAALAQTPSHSATPPPITCLPFHAALHPFSRVFTAPVPSPILALLLLSPLSSRATHPFCLCKGEEPGTRGAEEVGRRRAGSLQAQLEGRLSVESLHWASEPSTSKGIKAPRAPKG